MLDKFMLYSYNCVILEAIIMKKYCSYIKNRKSPKKWRVQYAVKNSDGKRITLLLGYYETEQEAMNAGLQNLHIIHEYRNYIPNKNKKSRQIIQSLATPKWLQEYHYNAIKQIYKNCKLLNKITKLKYSVDHVIPLAGKNVCGLHVPWNLQIITKSQNSKKGNKLLNDE